MAEYIERERARSEAKRYFKNLDEIQEDLDMIFCMLPAEDVAPVRHGRWEIVVGSNGKEYMVCTACRVSQDLTGVFSYCPNCGAKMDGGENDG